MFLAQVNVYAEHADSWQELFLGVEGKFLADADGDGSFQDSYLSALRRFILKISDEAEKKNKPGTRQTNICTKRSDTSTRLAIQQDG